jgi:hypothetical protein
MMMMSVGVMGVAREWGEAVGIRRDEKAKYESCGPFAREGAPKKTA